MTQMQTVFTTYLMIHEVLDVIPNILVGCQLVKGVEGINIVLSIPVTIYLQHLAYSAGLIKDIQSKSEI